MSENGSHMPETNETNEFNENGVISAFEELLRDPTFSEKVLAASASNRGLDDQTRVEIQKHIFALR